MHFFYRMITFLYLNYLKAQVTRCLKTCYRRAVYHWFLTIKSVALIKKLTGIAELFIIPVSTCQNPLLTS